MRSVCCLIAALLLPPAAQAADPCLLQPQRTAGGVVRQALDWAEKKFPGYPVAAVCLLGDGSQLISIAPAGAVEGTYRFDARTADAEPVAVAAPITERPKLVHDTAGAEWLLWDSLFLHMGEEAHLFALARRTDGAAHRLARTAGVDCEVHPDGTAVESSAKLEDANGDGVADIVLNWTETNCRTEVVKTFRRVYLAGPDGFSRQR
jgi:hypothetical protein